MKVGKKLMLFVALAAFAMFVIGGTSPIASATASTCTWTVDKTASLHSNPRVTITDLNLALNETVTVDYKIRRHANL